MSLSYMSQWEEQKKPRSPAPIQAKPQTNLSNSSLLKAAEKPLSMPGGIKSKMENAFHADLSGVSLYESPSVSRQGFSAVSQGGRIGFAPGAFQPSTFSGQALLGHELSHSVTHARGETPSNGGRLLSSPSLESRADSEGAAAAQGHSVGGASRVSVSAGSGTSAPVQGAPRKHADKTRWQRLKQNVFGTSDDNKQKLVDSMPYIRAAVERRGLRNAFILTEDTVQNAEAISGEGGEKEHTAFDVLDKIGQATGHSGDMTGLLSSIAKEESAFEHTMGIGGSALGAVGNTLSMVDSIKGVTEERSAESVGGLVYDIIKVVHSIFDNMKSIGGAAGWEPGFLKKGVPIAGIVMDGFEAVQNAWGIFLAGKKRVDIAKFSGALQKELAQKSGGLSYDDPGKALYTLREKQEQAKSAQEAALSAETMFKGLCGGDMTDSKAFISQFKAARNSVLSARKTRNSAMDAEQAAAAESEQTLQAVQSSARASKYLEDYLQNPEDERWKRHKRSQPLMEGHRQALERHEQAKENKAEAIAQKEEAEGDFTPFRELAKILEIDHLTSLSGAGAYALFSKRIKILKKKADEAFDNAVKDYYHFSANWDRFRGMNIAGKVTSGEIAEGVFDLTSNILSITGNALELAGVSGAAGIALSATAGVVNIAKVATLKLHGASVRRTNIRQELGAKAMHQQAAIQASGKSVATSHQGRYAQDQDKLEKIDEIIQDIIDEVYSKNSALGNVTSDQKKAHGRTTTKLYKHAILHEMGVPSGYRADLSNNISVNRAARHIIGAHQELGPTGTPHPQISLETTPMLATLRGMRLYHQPVERKNALRKGGGWMVDKAMGKDRGKLPSLGDTSKAFGNQNEAYKTLIKRDPNSLPTQIEKWAGDMGVSQRRVERRNERQLRRVDREDAGYKARQFGTHMMRGFDDSQEQKSLAEVTA